MSKIRSVQTKIVLSIVLMALVISTVLIYVSYSAYKSEMDKHYDLLGNHVAQTAISLLDADEMETYAKEVMTADPEAVMSSERYQEILTTLTKIKESNEVLYLYIIYPSEDGAYFVFDTDETEDVCPYGYFMTYYEGSFANIADELIKGETVPSVISDQEYGWIISISRPYHNEGRLVGYVCVDISMDEVMMDRRVYLLKSVLIIAGITLAFAVAYMILFSTYLVRPIKQMTTATADFVAAREDEKQAVSTISSLDVKTGDELQTLCESLKKMEQDINTHIDNLRNVTAEKERIGAELSIAAQIQSDMLPSIFPAFPDRKEFDIYAGMTPAKEVGGDFYDFFMVDDRHLAVVMADVSGKGIPAALFMVIGKTLIKDRTQPDRDLGEVFTEVNNILCESNSEGLFITAFEGVLDLDTGEFNFVNAGHEAPYIYRQGGAFERYKIRPGFVLAGMEDYQYTAGSLTLGVGDKLFEYTDGVTESTNAQNELYGHVRLRDALTSNCGKKPSELLSAVKEDIDSFVADAPQFDDITMLCLEYKGKDGRYLMKELTINATVENIAEVTAFVEEQLESLGCPMKAQMQICVAIDELFGNIAQYAYNPDVGPATVRVEVVEEPMSVIITFIDKGVPFDPLSLPEPDTTLSSEKRQTGGLGIFIVKKSMDEITYEYKDGQNILRIKKTI